ncbi:glycoside hydrolase family 3 N-terminal domain-containing protein [Streptomyces sp. NPDC014727]|uniref:glycoside hydrolase family 3 N-terminal domain-containing protein n=2 Tax=unclassified Streptomyces TaxID=2593676 RepID=UPI0036F83681
MPAELRHSDGTPFRDLNHNGTMEPYEDPRLPVEDRVEDLLGRMTLAEKAALMCHGRMVTGPDPRIPIPMPTGAELITERGVTHFAMMAVPDARTMAEWNNHVQDLAAAGRLGIPVTLSSDPRHGFASNPATAHAGGGFSTGPEPIGLAATDDPELVEEYARLIGRELCAVGIRVAIHPMADLATEPRWARISGTFGEDPQRAARTIGAYIRGLQGASIGKGSVACMTKHFPSGGPQYRGEDSHFAAGRRLVYPGGAFEQHLTPFEAAFAAGTAQIMPTYAIPSGSGLAEVGANFNRDVITGPLRERYGFDGVICTDFNAITGTEIPGLTTFPPRNRGVEELSVAEQVVLTLPAAKVRHRQLVEVRASAATVALHATVPDAQGITLLAVHPRAVGRGARIVDEAHWQGLPDGHTRATTTDPGDRGTRATGPARGADTEPGGLVSLLTRARAAHVHVGTRPLALYDQLTGTRPFTPAPIDPKDMR